jgi:hypothetical protein
MHAHIRCEKHLLVSLVSEIEVVVSIFSVIPAFLSFFILIALATTVV